MQALVTGAGGFVGTHLRHHLESCGDSVVSTDRANGGVDMMDSPGVAELVKQAAPEVIYHLAGQSDVAASWRDPVGTLEINATGTLNILSAAADAHVARVLVVTSAEVYGVVDAQQLPVAEHQPLNPSSPYAASKAAAEMISIQWANSGLGVIRARAFNHLGPGQSERFVAAALGGRIVRALAERERSIVVGNLDTRRDFTDVRDVVRAYRLLATHGTAGEAYNVCSGTDHSIAELVGLFMDRAGHQLELVPDPALQRPSDLPVLRGDPGKVHQATGWKPEVPLETTIDDIISAVRAADASPAQAP